MADAPLVVDQNTPRLSFLPVNEMCYHNSRRALSCRPEYTQIIFPTCQQDVLPQWQTRPELQTRIHPGYYPICHKMCYHNGRRALSCRPEYTQGIILSVTRCATTMADAPLVVDQNTPRVLSYLSQDVLPQ